MTTRTLEIIIPQRLWMTSNHRLSWQAKSRRSRELRELAHWSCRAHRLKPMKRARVFVDIQYPTQHPSDPSNAEPTFKPLIDGMIDYGVLIDDSWQYLEGPYPRRADGLSKRGFHVMRFEFVPLEALAR
mgnify:CR=1 FL=1